jgi:hypothetical protein
MQCGESLTHRELNQPTRGYAADPVSPFQRASLFHGIATSSRRGGRLPIYYILAAVLDILGRVIAATRGYLSDVEAIIAIGGAEMSVLTAGMSDLVITIYNIAAFM